MSSQPTASNAISETEETLPILESQQAYLEQHETQLVLQLVEIRAMLASVRAKVADLKNVNRNASIYSLPAETLADIFEAGRQLPLNDRDIPFPVLVSHVSRRFRSIAIHESTLWTDIYTSQSSSSMDWLDIRLTRSGACLLDLRIKLLHDDEDDEDDEDDVHCLLERILPHHKRLRRLSIRSPESARMYSLLSAFDDISVPSLESIHIYMVYHCDEDYRPMSVFGGGAPLLTSIRLHRWSLDALKAPLDAVTTFRLDMPCRPVPFNDFCEAIHDMPHLENLILSADAVAYDGQPSIEIMSLVSLDVAFQSSPPSGLEPSALITPTLESLTLRHANKDRLSAFVHFLRGSSSSLRYPALHTLEVDSWATNPMRNEDVVGLMTGLPNIRHIAFRSAPSGIFYRLCTDTSANPLWPRLETITLDEIGDDAASLLCLMVSHRASLGAPKLQLKSSLDEVPEDTIEWLRERVDIIEKLDDSDDSDRSWW